MENLKDKPWHPLPAEELVQFLGVNSSTSLSADQVRHRQKGFGPNRVTARLALRRQRWLPKILQRELAARLVAKVLAATRWLQRQFFVSSTGRGTRPVSGHEVGTMIVKLDSLRLLPMKTEQMPETANQHDEEGYLPAGRTNARDATEMDFPPSISAKEFPKCGKSYALFAASFQWRNLPIGSAVSPQDHETAW